MKKDFSRLEACFAAFTVSFFQISKVQVTFGA